MAILRDMLNSMFVALAMYSKLPVPQVEWQKKNMAYALAFFPVVGVFCGGWLLLWRFLADYLALGNFMWAVGAMLGPLLITGGIHLDGFCDVTDALSSWQTKERRLEILKDSHFGAFALIGCCCYLLVYLAVWTEIQPDYRACLFIGLGYVLCRVLSGLSIANLRCAKTSGLAATFAGNADRRGVTIFLLVWLAGVIVGLFCLNRFWALCSLAVAAACFVYYRWLAYSHFGGINGDLAGWFLQILELAWLLLIFLLQRLA